MSKTSLDYTILDGSYFPQMADVLLNNCYLKIKGQKYRLIEIEFYLNSKHHPDLYAHTNPDQLIMNAFYFHRFGNGTYKGGNYCGLDMSYGSKSKKAFFGILIRAIEKVKSGQIIEGPCNVVRHILASYDYDSIIKFTKNQNLNIFDNRHDFVLVKKDNLEKRQLFCGPRIGLSAKYPSYQNCNYRFVADKNKIKKKKTTLIKLQ